MPMSVLFRARRFEVLGPRRLAVLVAVSAALSVPWVASPPAAASITELAAAIDSPTRGRPVERPESIQIGRGTLEPQPGSTVSTLRCGTEVCGLAIDGPTRFRYRVEDRFSQPVAARNFKKVSSVSLAGGKAETAAVAEKLLTGAVIWGWEVAGSFAVGGDASEESGGPLPGWATKILDRALFGLPSNDLAAARRLAGEGEISALLHGKEDWLLFVDPVVAKDEGLYRLESLTAIYDELKGELALRELAFQPVGRAWWEVSPAPVVATESSIRVDNPSGSTLKIRTRTHLQATRDGTGLWRARLLDRRFDSREREVPNRVDSVTVNGKPAEFLHQRNELLVVLDPPLAAGATAEVEVVNGGELAIRPGQDSYWFLFGSWYPSPPANGERAVLEMEVRVPDPYTAFASGTTLERSQEDGLNVVRTRLEHPTQHPVVIVGKYEVFEEKREGLTCRVASYGGGKEKASRRLAGNLFAAVGFYQQLFNRPYPFTEVDVVEINSWGFGVAPAGAIFITKEAYDPIGSTTSRRYSQGVNERYVHEVAHAWWGHVSRPAAGEENWLNESFAEYSSALCMQAMKGGKAGEREFIKLLREWKSRTQQIGAGGSIYLAGHLGSKQGDDSARRDRGYLLYSKGPLVLHALRQELARQLGGSERGDRHFFALLRTFLKHVEPGWAETRDLVGILNQISGHDWQPWFERYVYGTETPKIER